MPRLRHAIQEADKSGEIRQRKDAVAESEHNAIKITYEESAFLKRSTSLEKVYFPHSGNSPGGFRPIDETSDGSSLSYVQAKQHKISRISFLTY